LVMWIYYEIGVFVGKYIKAINIKAHKILDLTLLGLYAFIFVLYLNSNGIINLSLKIICALLAVAFLYNLTKYNKAGLYKILIYLGKRTSFIYYLHNPYIVLVLITGFTEFTKINVVVSIAITFSLGIILPLIIGELVLTRNKV
ncbi:MAG: hypothetical protein ACYDG2_21355, partial [Ruminiclostridium sp.]